MKIAYLTSVYPAVSQQFIVREVQGLRARGMDVQTFSVRKAQPADVVGPEAEKDFASTPWLIPASAAGLLGAVLWGLFTRPTRIMQALLDAVLIGGVGLVERVKWLVYFAEALLLSRRLARVGFEHLHCHFGNAGSSVAMLAARICDLPFSITCHGSELREIRRFRLAEKARRASFIACVSHFGRAQLMLAAPNAWSKLNVVRCGVSADVEPSPGAGSTELLCVGRLSAEKGHLVLLQALHLLRSEGVSFRCTLVGDGPMRRPIEETIARLGLERLVRLTGSLAPDAVERLYASSGVVVLASFSEGVPVVLMEAMARRIPVVATAVGGIPELVQDGVSGVVVPPGDAQALATGIRRVLSDPQQAKQMGERGAARVREEFNLDRSIARLQQLFEEVRVSQRALVRPATATP